MSAKSIKWVVGFQVVNLVRAHTARRVTHCRETLCAIEALYILNEPNAVHALGCMPPGTIFISLTYRLKTTSIPCLSRLMHFDRQNFSEGRIRRTQRCYSPKIFDGSKKIGTTCNDNSSFLGCYGSLHLDSSLVLSPPLRQVTLDQPGTKCQGCLLLNREGSQRESASKRAIMVSSTGQVSDSRVASAAGECTAETGIEVNSPAEMTASTGLFFAIFILSV